MKKGIALIFLLTYLPLHAIKLIVNNKSPAPVTLFVEYTNKCGSAVVGAVQSEYKEENKAPAKSTAVSVYGETITVPAQDTSVFVPRPTEKTILGTFKKCSVKAIYLVKSAINKQSIATQATLNAFAVTNKTAKKGKGSYDGTFTIEINEAGNFVGIQ